MLDVWRELHDRDHGLTMGHSMENPVTSDIITTVLEDARKRKSSERLPEYRMLDVGSSPMPKLGIIFHLTTKYMRPELKKASPKFKTTALDVAPLSKSVDLSADPKMKGFNYVEGEAQALPFKNGKIHALTMTTLLEYLNDKEKEEAVREAHRVMADDGLLMLVLHSANSNLPERQSKKADRAIAGFKAMNSYFSGKLSRAAALKAIEKNKIHENYGYWHPEMMLRVYESDPEKKEEVAQLLDGKVFEKQKELAVQMGKGRFKSLEEVQSFLDRCGFNFLGRLMQVSSKGGRLRVEGHTEGDELWVVTARKKPTKPLLGAGNQREQSR